MALAATVLIAEKFTISVSTNNKRYQLFQIMFQKRDGSIFVNFPYQPNNASYLNRITLKADLVYPNNINIKNGGKVTSHKVKFSHHTDGRSHFSQDSKVYTKIFTHAAKLTNHNGHLFTIHIGGIDGFNEIPVDTSNDNNKKTFIDIEVPDLVNLKFTAYWYSDSYLKDHLKEYNVTGGPNIIFSRKDKPDLKGIMIENIFINNEDDNYYLFLGFETDPKLITKKEPSILFLGGFEHPSISLNHENDTSFLMLAYPTLENYLSLLQEIGTIDIEQSLFIK